MRSLRIRRVLRHPRGVRQFDRVWSAFTLIGIGFLSVNALQVFV